MTKRDVERFNGKVLKNANSCWDWAAGLSPTGYGIFQYKNRVVRAHRFALMIHGTEIPKEMVVDHLCRNRKCVRPDHLRVVDQKQNAIKNSTCFARINSDKTHCKHGHPFDEKNTYFYSKYGRPARGCKTCGRLAQERNRAKQSNPRKFSRLAELEKRVSHLERENAELRAANSTLSASAEGLKLKSIELETRVAIAAVERGE